MNNISNSEIAAISSSRLASIYSCKTCRNLIITDYHNNMAIKNSDFCRIVSFYITLFRNLFLQPLNAKRKVTLQYGSVCKLRAFSDWTRQLKTTASKLYEMITQAARSVQMRRLVYECSKASSVVFYTVTMTPSRQV